jgi:imidazoleglycerol-phosphate dehydratase/histidinol-phosphatase
VPYLQDRGIDWTRSAMVGDRDSDIAFAATWASAASSLRIALRRGEWDWAGDRASLADAPRIARVARTRETRIA